MEDQNVYLIINVFVSSTFKDMDFERDYLKDIIIPRLNTELEDYNVRVELCDLRSGIADIGKTEEEQDDYVLTSCFSAIQKSQPFFIALIGERYGWIPERRNIERLRDVFHYHGIDVDSLIGKSVTEIEITLGCLVDQYLCNGIICFRSSDSYSNIPEDICDIYVENDETAKKSLIVLKDIIRKTYIQHNRKDLIVDYKLSWNRNGFSGLDAWGETIFKLLKKQILSSYGKPKNSAYNRTKQIMDRFVFNKLFKSVDLFADWSNYAKKNITRHYQKLVFIGPEGFGASTFLCHQYINVLTDKTNVFPIFYSLDSIETKKDFIDIVDFLTTMTNEYVRKLYGKIPVSNTNDYLAKLEHAVNLITVKGFNILFIIDSYHKINIVSNPYSHSLRWIPKNSAIIISCDFEWQSKFSEDAQLFVLTPLTQPKAVAYIKSMGYSDINDDVISKLLSPLYPNDNKTEASYLYFRSPLYLKMVIELLVDLNHDNYNEIRNSECSNYYDALKRFREIIIPKEPIYPEFLFMQIVNRHLRLIQGNGLLLLFMISLSKNGLTEKTMRNCMKFDDYTFTKFFSIVYNKFKQYLSYSSDTNKWYFQYELCKRSIQIRYSKIFNVSHTYESILNEIAPYSLDEGIVQDDLFYYIVFSDNFKMAETILCQARPEVISSGVREIAEGITNEISSVKYTEWCKEFLLSGGGCNKEKIAFITNIVEIVGSLSVNKYLLKGIKDISEIIISKYNPSCEKEVIDFCNLMTDIFICEDLQEEASSINIQASKLLEEMMSSNMWNEHMDQLTRVTNLQSKALRIKDSGLRYDGVGDEINGLVDSLNIDKLQLQKEDLEEELKLNPQSSHLKCVLVKTYIQIAIVIYDTDFKLAYDYYISSINIVNELLKKHQTLNDLRTCASLIFQWCKKCANSNDFEKCKEGLLFVLLIDKKLVSEHETKENLINIADTYNWLTKCYSKTKDKDKIIDIVKTALDYIFTLEKYDFDVCCKLWLTHADTCKQIGAYYESFYIYDTMADEIVACLQKNPAGPYMLLLIDIFINIAEVIFLDGNNEAGIYRMQYAFQQLEEARKYLHSQENVNYMLEQEKRCHALMNKYCSNLIG